MDLFKKHWKQATVYGAVVAVLGGLFWQYGIGSSDLRALGTIDLLQAQVDAQDKTDASILAELTALRATEKERIKELAAMASEVNYLVKHSDEMRADIKELLQR